MIRGEVGRAVAAGAARAAARRGSGDGAPAAARTRCRCGARCWPGAGSARTTTSTLVAPRDRRAVPARAVRRARRSAGRTRRCCCAARSRSTGPPRRRVRRHRARSWSACTAAAPSGWPRSGRATPVDVVGPLGPPFRLPRDPVGCLLVGGGYGSRAAVLAGRRAAGPGLPGGLPARCRQRRTGCSACWTRKRMAGAVAVTTDDGSAGHPRAGSPTCCPSVIARDRHRRRSTPAARWRCCVRSARSPAAYGHAVPGARSRSRWPAGSGSA